ncbi:rubredoxin [Candidatus Methylospira mobilis]|uniref:Rubredoxin n=1 Tax=Candidatus Methylospira mobilis TaxID=1808979 RepID=A0A5Q0BLI5_9GAMM|nr:rubredoxin [Candidatus Methylospira mobilis]QFY44795.1 rubredoxin [Candidatus Methylospira mobilis]WNV05664.1 rubredoxin [Candidatus Methylospira mobilis]
MSRSGCYECRICWYLYDPELGDDSAQIAAGTRFEQLPPDWSCPQCDNPRQVFLACADATERE